MFKMLASMTLFDKVLRILWFYLSAFCIFLDTQVSQVHISQGKPMCTLLDSNKYKEKTLWCLRLNKGANEYLLVYKLNFAPDHRKIHHCVHTCILLQLHFSRVHVIKVFFSELVCFQCFLVKSLFLQKFPTCVSSTLCGLILILSDACRIIAHD